MLGRSLTSPLLTFESTACLCTSFPDCSLPVTNYQTVTANSSNSDPHYVVRGPLTRISTSKKWELHSTTIDNTVLADEDKTKWDACRGALAAFGFSAEEKDKILGKAFGHTHSPYWSEERKREVPNHEMVSQTLDYLRSLSLTDDDLCKVLKKFPEVLGCSLDEELKHNVQILGKDWGIEGKTLRNLLLRNPKVLGYTVDCKGDCIAQCTRCWARF